VKSDCHTSLGGGSLEAVPGAARPLARLGHDEAGGVEDAPDGRGRGDRQSLPPEMPGDGGGACVEAPGGKLDPEGGDPVPHRAGRRVPARARPARPWLDGVEALVAVPAQEPVQVAAADAALRCRGGDRQLR
jgi:hypothetical protein